MMEVGLSGFDEKELQVNEEVIAENGESSIVDVEDVDDQIVSAMHVDSDQLTVLEEETDINMKLNPPPTYQNLIIQHMDIAEPLISLKNLLEMRLQCSLADHEFYLTDTLLLDSSKSLVDQCVQGEGMVQVNLEIKSQPSVKPKINIVDVLKPADEIDPVVDTSTDPEELMAPPTPRTVTSKKVKAESTPQQITRWAVDQIFRKEQERLHIPFDPLLWTQENVRYWINWAIKEFRLASVDPEQFAFDGTTLCGLTHPDFVRLIPIDRGDIFWTHLELLRKCKFVAVIQQAQPVMLGRQTTAKVKGRQRLRPMKMVGENRMTGPGNRTGNNGQIQLWQFLLELLTDKDCQEVIQWVGDEGEFKLLNPEIVAQLWGERKNKPAMNYEKLSRALRYYYDGDMISKVSGKRFTYRYVCDLQFLIGYTAADLRRLVNESAQKKMLLKDTVWSSGVVKLVKTS